MKEVFLDNIEFIVGIWKDLVVVLRLVLFILLIVNCLVIIVKSWDLRMIGGFFGMWFCMIVLYIIFVILNILDVSVWILNLILVFIYISNDDFER